jgi:hypothetical protein
MRRICHDPSACKCRATANAQIFKPLDQLRNSPIAGLSPGEASHDCFPQVDANGLDLNAFFKGLAGFSNMLRHACGFALADQGADTRLIHYGGDSDCGFAS